MVAVFIAFFIAFGIATLYPKPPPPELPPQRAEIELRPPPAPYPVPEYKPTPQEEERLRQEKERWRELEKKQGEYRELEKKYRRNVFFLACSLGLVIFIIGFLLPRLPEVITSGLLVGGLSTYVYGVIQAYRLISDSLRFIAFGVGLAALIFLGYWKLRERKSKSL